jgi:hypothetical protein
MFRITIGKQPLVKVFQNELLLSYYTSYYTFKNLDNTKEYDYLFFGSSHAYKSFDPAIFQRHGFSSYNMGTTNQSPLNTYCLLKHIPFRAKKIILEVYPEASNNTGKEAFFDINNNYGNIPALSEMACRINDLRCYNLLSINPLIHWYNQKRPVINPANYLGYVETDSVYQGPVIPSKLILYEKTFTSQLKYIQLIAELCRQKNTELILVYAPVPEDHHLVNEGLFIQKIYLLSHKESIRFINLGRAHQLSHRDYFYDNDHLNKKGVAIFNEELIKKLNDKDPFSHQ